MPLLGNGTGGGVVGAENEDGSSWRLSTRWNVPRTPGGCCCCCCCNCQLRPRSPSSRGTAAAVADDDALPSSCSSDDRPGQCPARWPRRARRSYLRRGWCGNDDVDGEARHLYSFGTTPGRRTCDGGPTTRGTMRQSEASSGTPRAHDPLQRRTMMTVLLPPPPPPPPHWQSSLCCLPLAGRMDPLEPTTGDRTDGGEPNWPRRWRLAGACENRSEGRFCC
jgi:hypothetical protein